MNVYSSNNKELPKATTQQGTPRSNITVRSAQKQQDTQGTPKSSNTSRNAHKQHHGKELPSL